MAKTKPTVTIYDHAIKKLVRAQAVALKKTAEALHTDVLQEQVIPFDEGDLQNENTFVDYSKSKTGIVSLVSQTPYARRLYYHPEYNFSKRENPNAQGKWLEPWIRGGKKDFCKNAFTEFYKQETGL